MGGFFSGKHNYHRKYSGSFIDQINKCQFLYSWNNRLSKKIYKIIQWQNIDKYKYKYDIYDVIINSLNDCQIRKLQFIKNEFEKYIKYCDYAEEQCVIQEKMLLSISQMNTYSDELNIIVETLIMEPIQKHICLISTYTIIVYPSFIFIINPDSIDTTFKMINKIHKNKKLNI